MTKRLLLLVLGALAFWLIAVYPARLLFGDAAVVFSAVAGLICLVPTVATLAWSQRALQGRHEQQLLAVMGSTGIRMAFVIAAAMVLFHTSDEFHHQQFLLWVVVFYLVTLALEVSLLVQRSRTDEVSN